jgi:nifR3 family TIM-barrel protein
MIGFWKEKLELAKNENRPLVVVAPMADVTDVAFRPMIAKYSRMGQLGGGPDVMWNEFISADGLNSRGREVLKRDLGFSEIERPIVAQLFTSNPENMYEAVKYCREIGYDGVDINMGCPVDIINKQGAGAGLIQNPELAREVIMAAKRAAGENFPVSVKTRLGWSKVEEWQEWLGMILSCDIPVLTIHLRTKKEMSLVDAHWDLYPDIKKFCKLVAPQTILIGNGDVKDLSHAMELYEKYGAEGVMIGRGIFGAPWIFDWQGIGKTLQEKMEIMLEHTKLFEETVGQYKSFSIMKKHYKAYVNGFDGASVLRVKLMETNSYEEVETIVREFLDTLN